MLSNNFRPKRQRRLSVEKLDGRNLFAALTGTVAIDTNHNDALDVFELTSGPTLSGDPPVAGALVWIDTNGTARWMTKIVGRLQIPTAVTVSINCRWASIPSM